MNARDWMMHSVRLSESVIAAYQRSAQLQHIYSPAQIDRERMLVALEREAIGLMGRGEALDGELALVGAYLRKYAQMHLDHMVDSPEFAEGMAEARILLAQVGMVEEVMV